MESDIAGRDPISVDVTGLSPATQYVCKVAAFNGNGVGNSGSNVFVETLDAGQYCVCECECTFGIELYISHKLFVFRIS